MHLLSNTLSSGEDGRGHQLCLVHFRLSASVELNFKGIYFQALQRTYSVSEATETKVIDELVANVDLRQLQYFKWTSFEYYISNSISSEGEKKLDTEELTKEGKYNDSFFF